MFSSPQKFYLSRNFILVATLASGGSGLWVQDAGTWTIVANELRVAPPASTMQQAHVSGQSFANGVVEVRAKASADGNGDIGPVARADTGLNRYQTGNLDFAGSLHRIRKRIAGAESNIKTASFNPSANTYYGLRAYLSGSSLKSWVNGVTALSRTDTSLSGAGFWGLMAWRSGSAITFTFDDFALYTSPTITMQNLPAGGSWSVINSSGGIISCKTASTWDASTYTGQIPISYASGGGKVSVWTNSNCSGGASATYPATGLANDIFGGDVYSYSGGTSRTLGMVRATSTITISPRGVISF